MNAALAIHWYRLDLRTEDLPALQAAADHAEQVLPVYILDEETAGDWRTGGASRWWLHHSLAALGSAIEAGGGQLLLRQGDSAAVLRAICREYGVTRVHCTRRYEPWAAAQETAVHQALQSEGITLKRYPGHLLHEPGSVLTQAGDPFRVFTPFWRACRRQEVAALSDMSGVRWAAARDSLPLQALELLPSGPDWAAGWREHWFPGTAGAHRALQAFLEGPVSDYAEGRNLPAETYTSRLSPHLHHGEISPRQVWHACEARAAVQPELLDALSKFQSELGWREFSYHLLHFFPQIPEQAFREDFAAFPWLDNPAHLRAWQRGDTGYPIVDAGMRELWQTGYMHNRVRMVVASFLCKHLLLHWRHGENWFWDTLVDADLASNSCSWQWVAGSGADAAPYFRIFNPVAQGEKFDRQGDYVRRWVPELAQLPARYIHQPWTAPEEILAQAGVSLGESYPEPLVDHRAARQGALDAYATLKRR